MRVAFDVDGTLIDFNDRPRPVMLLLLSTLLYAGNEVIVWSGGGREYAAKWAERLGVLDRVTALGKFDPAVKDLHVDLAFDDEKDTLMADQMVIVGRARG